MIRARKQRVGAFSRQCLILVSILISASINPINLFVEGFSRPTQGAFSHCLVPNKQVNGMGGVNYNQRGNVRSLALQAASFTSSSPNFRTAPTGRIRLVACSTRLFDSTDGNDGDKSDSPSPYWFAKVKSSSASADTSQSLPQQDLPVEEPSVDPTPPPSPKSPPQEPQYLHKSDLPMQETRAPLTPPWDATSQSPPASKYSRAADSSWTDIATPKPTTDTTSNRQPASNSGFMPIFGVVPETTPAPSPPPQPYKQYQQDAKTIRSAVEKKTKRTKPKGASDQEKDLADANIATERTTTKGASDQEKDLADANIATEPAQSGLQQSASFLRDVPPVVPPPSRKVVPVSPTTDDIQQGQVIPRSTIKVQEIDDENEEYDDEDTSVAPIILEYLSKDEDGDTAYLQTIVFPFSVDPNVRAEEQVGRENDAPMFTPAVKADIYKVLRSPNDPKRGGEAPPSSGPPKSDDKSNAPRSPFAATLLAKMDEGTYAFCDRSLYDSIEQHKQDAEPTAAKQWEKLATFTPLDDDQMLKCVASIGQTSPNSLAITKAFEAYLSQKAWGWGDYQASAFSVEFLIAFGNELSSRLDVNHRIRSRKLSDQELAILSKPPFCNYVQPDTMRIFQNKWNHEDKETKRK